MVSRSAVADATTLADQNEVVDLHIHNWESEEVSTDSESFAEKFRARPRIIREETGGAASSKGHYIGNQRFDEESDTIWPRSFPMTTHQLNIQINKHSPSSQLSQNPVRHGL